MQNAAKDTDDDKVYVISLVEPVRVETFDITGSYETATRIGCHLLGASTRQCLICSPNRVSFFPSSPLFGDIVDEIRRWLETDNA